VNPRAIVRPTDGYSVAKARTRLRRPILLITVDRRGTLTPARPAVKSGAVDNRQHRPRTLAGSVAPPACNCVRASDIYRQPSRAVARDVLEAPLDVPGEVLDFVAG